MKTIELNNGVRMPLLGYGVFQIPPADCEACVTNAIHAGYRLIDTAQGYFNEAEVGNAVAKSGIDRKEFFLVTKVWISNAGEARAAASIDASLEKLGTDYVDLLLIHQPFGDVFGTWRAMERAYADGKVRAIGLSNFYDGRYIDICEHADVKPAVVQLEAHVFSQQKRMREPMRADGTRLMAWAPFAEGRNGLFTNPTLEAIGRRHGKSAAQTALRYLYEEDIIAIPKSVNPARMAENIAIEDFALDDVERAEIAALDTGRPLIVPDFNSADFAKMIIQYGK